MPNNTNNIHENEAMHMIPYVEFEYERYRASKQKNRIVYALAVTNIAWFVLFLAFMIFK
jgi:hypothetical protein